MSQIKPQSLSAAGKVFIIGEYAVLAGLPAVVASVSPRFKLSSNLTGAAELFHAASPIGRLLSRLSAKPKVTFYDPYEGGGFGASTAQFALLYAMIANEMGWRNHWIDVWKLYRELTAGPEVPPSGADLVAQWNGGVVVFDPRHLSSTNVYPLFDWSCILVFSAAHQKERKTATHEHLARLTPSIVEELGSELKSSLQKGIESIWIGDRSALASAFLEYATVLRKRGLEAPATREDCLAISECPGVLGVKGSGALLSDSIVVVVDGRTEEKQRLIGLAESRGLRFISDGLLAETGVAGK